MCIDGVLCHVRNLCPFPYAENNPVEYGILTSTDDEICITVGDCGDGNDCLVDFDLGDSSDGNDHQPQQLTLRPSQNTDEPAVPRLRRSDRWKRSPHDNRLCNDNISWEHSHPTTAPNDIRLRHDFRTS